MAAALQQLNWGSERGYYELSVGNPDKGTLALEEVLWRIEQFTTAQLPIVVTHVRSNQVSPCVPDAAVGVSGSKKALLQSVSALPVRNCVASLKLVCCPAATQKQ